MAGSPFLSVMSQEESLRGTMKGNFRVLALAAGPPTLHHSPLPFERRQKHLEGRAPQELFLPFPAIHATSRPTCSIPK